MDVSALFKCMSRSSTKWMLIRSNRNIPPTYATAAGGGGGGGGGGG